jgi:hypothetical protein
LDDIRSTPKGVNLFHNKNMTHPDHEFHITISGGFEENDVLVYYDGWKGVRKAYLDRYYLYTFDL